MGNSDKGQYNKQNDIELNIFLNKACYNPGEEINGILSIKGKPTLKKTIFDDTSAIIKIVQMQRFSYEESSGMSDATSTITIKEDTDLVSENVNFINFKNSNLLVGINIPFSIRIPIDIQPSVFIKNDFMKNGFILNDLYTDNFYKIPFIKHFISFEFPGLESKRSLMIIIKNFKKFSFENKLLKMPAYGFGDFYKKKKGKYKGGKLSCLLKIPKNSFSFFEIISFELYLDCTVLGMDIESTTIFLNKAVYMNKKIKRHFRKILNEDLIEKKYVLDKNLDKYEIKDFLQLKEDKEFFQKIYQQNEYSYFDSIKNLELDYNYNNYQLTPFCIGGLLSVEFTLRVEVKYKMKREKSEFVLPIQFYNSELNEIENQKNNDYFNFPQNTTNINSINNVNNIENEENIADFVVIENNDIEKVFFGNEK